MVPQKLPSRWSWRLTPVHVFPVHYIVVCEKPELNSTGMLFIEWRMCEDDLKFAFWKLRAHLSLCMHIGYAGNNVEHRRDQSSFDFSPGISFRFFSEISCFLTILYGTSYIVCDKRTSLPYKNRSYIHKTSDSLRLKFLSALCKKTRDKQWWK